MIKEKISAKNYFLLLYLSSLCSVFMYLSSSSIKISQIDSALRPLIFIVVSILVSIPALVIVKIKADNEKNRVFVKKTNTLKAISFVYAVVYFISILKTVARFDLFVSSELFPNNDMVIFLVGIIVVCALLSLSGIGAISRSAVIFFILVAFSTSVVMFSLRNEISYFNFTPLFQNGVGEFIKESMLFSFQITELGTLIMFLPYVDGNVKKSTLIWSIFSGISFALVFFFVVGSLGSFADTQLFPTYTAVSLASFGLIKRIDALETSIWILCVVQKLSFYFFIIQNCLCYSFRRLSKNLVIIFLIAILSVVTGVLSFNIESFEYLSSDVLTVILFVVSAIILPVLLCFYLKVAPREDVKEDY